MELHEELQQLRAYQEFMEKKYQELNIKLQESLFNLDIFTNLMSLINYLNNNITSEYFYMYIVDAIYGTLGVEKCSIYKVINEHEYQYIAGETLDILSECDIQFNKILCKNNCHGIITPIKLEQEILLLIVSHKNREIFTPYVVSFLEILCKNLSLVIENYNLYRQLKFLAERDSLTGLYNRRVFYEKAKHIQGDFGVSILDIDFFKKVNDTYGHDIGDLVLKEFANILKSYESESIVPARYGGEEFIILFKEPSSTQKILNEIQQRVRQLSIHISQGDFKITFSAGACISNKCLAEAIKAADENLYKVKKTTRNDIIIS